MKLIFRTIVGMIIISGLFMIFGSLSGMYMPEFKLITSAAKGFLYINLFMGSLVIVYTIFEMVFRADIEE